MMAVQSKNTLIIYTLCLKAPTIVFHAILIIILIAIKQIGQKSKWQGTNHEWYIRRVKNACYMT